MARTAPKQKVRKQIFIVDDHPVFREGLVSLVKREPAWIVCGEADSAPEALTAIGRLKPDLVLVDVGLQGRSGLELLKDLLAIDANLPVLVISMHDEMLYAERALRAGARGYIMKQEPPEKLLEAVRQALNGQIYLSGQMSVRILHAFSSRRVQGASPIGELTDRELEILNLIGHGHDSHAIARQLNLSPKTVDAHRGHIKAKLHLRNGTELISYAARWVESESVGAKGG
jgi:DNA-binding NarL/FixJ family response regulator